MNVYSIVSSPIGDLLLVSDTESLTGLYTPGHGRRPAPDWVSDPEHPVLAATRTQLSEYFAGTRRAFDLPLASVGTAFQEAVWKGLRDIEFAHTESYLGLALRIGSPAAVRAVGAANGRNPISIVVPCHRVIGADGSLTGYAGGIEAKRWLLDHELRVAG